MSDASNRELDELGSEKVRRWVNPYPKTDFLRVVYRNLRQRPNTSHAGSVDWVGQDSIIDAEVKSEIEIAFLGDLMPIQTRRFVLSPDLVDFLGCADWLVGNLEGVLWPGQEQPPKVFSAQRHPNLVLLDPLAKIVGPERLVLSLANNHACDFGPDALAYTIDQVSMRGHKVFGTVAEPSVRLGPVNLAGVTNLTNQAHRYVPFLCDHADHIDHKAPFQLLYPHMGLEMETYPRPQTVAEIDDLLATWDAVVANHPHVPSPVSLRTVRLGSDRDPNGAPSQKLVAYSLGQAASDIPYRLYHRGLVLRLGIGKRPDGTYGVGSATWRSLNLDLSDTESVRATIAPTNTHE